MMSKSWFPSSAEYLDAMSAIICVIDYEKFKRGVGV